MVLALCLLASTGCSATPTATPTLSPGTPPTNQAAPGPTLAPSPTPGGSASTPGPLTDATQAIVLEPPDLPPTATQRVPSVNLPPEALTLFEPGPGSQVTSPLRVIGRGGPSFGERIRLRLYGADDQLLAEHTTILFAYPGNAGRFASQLAFHIDGVAEAGRLEIASFDRRYNRVDHIATQSLVLLSAGSPLVHQALQPPEKLDIVTPRDGQRVTGGELQVRGAGWVDSDVPVEIDLVDRYGKPLASTEARFDSPKVGQFGTFTVSLPYETPYSQFARVVFTERDPSQAHIVHLSSVEVYLQR